jgi:hypothetical protein
MYQFNQGMNMENIQKFDLNLSKYEILKWPENGYKTICGKTMYVLLM